jgi:hypothetical protein
MQNDENNGQGKRRRMQSEVVSLNSEIDEYHTKEESKPRCVQDEGFDMTQNGFISVPSSEWFDLTEDH